MKFLEATFFGLLLAVFGSVIMFSVKKIYKIKKCCNAECPDLDKHYMFRRMISLFISGFFLYIFYVEMMGDKMR